MTGSWYSAAAAAERIAPALGTLLCLLCACRIAARVDDRDAPLLDPVAALLVGLRVGKDDPDLLERHRGRKVVVDRQVHLGGDVERVFREPVQGLAHAAGLGVLHGDDPVAFPPGNRCHDRVDGGGKDERPAFQFQGNLVGEGALGPERDGGHRFTMQSIRASVVFCPFSQ